MKMTGSKGILLWGMVWLVSLSASAQLDPQVAVEMMRRGINMGNTLEAPYEGDWGNPPAEEVYFDLYKEAGFDVVRIPVRWHYHTSTESPYVVNPSWMDRVEEVADWGLSRGLFIVINAHHEEWIKEDYANPVNRARFDSIWSQIAVRFKDKSEKLLFEIINEPNGLTREQNNELHHRVLSIIRKSNPSRIVIIQGHNWGGAEELVEMDIPDDPYLIGSFHSYDPWPFGLEGTGSFGNPVQIRELDDKFRMVKTWSDENSIPVLLGEFGCNRTADYNSRMKHYRAYMDLSLTYGFTPCAWDDGGSFKILYRSARLWDEVKDILIHSSPTAPTITSLALTQDTLVTLRFSIGAGSPDSLSIQRRGLTSTFETIAVAGGESTVYLDTTTFQGNYYYYRIIAHHRDGEPEYSNPLRIITPSVVEQERGYFLGAPLDVPGVVEAEDFDLGGEGISYHDLDRQNIAGDYRPEEGVDIIETGPSMYHIINALPGEWYEYSLMVNIPGDYEVGVHYSAIFSGGSFKIGIGENQSDTIELEGTGDWLQTSVTRFHMILSEGEQIMRFTATGIPLFNLDKFEFSTPSSSRFTGTVATQSLLWHITGGNLVIRSPRNDSLGQLGLYHSSGILLWNQKCPGPMVCIPLDRLGSGIFLARAFNRGETFIAKIMIP